MAVLMAVVRIIDSVSHFNVVGFTIVDVGLARQRKLITKRIIHSISTLMAPDVCDVLLDSKLNAELV